MSHTLHSISHPKIIASEAALKEFLSRVDSDPSAVFVSVVVVRGSQRITVHSTHARACKHAEDLGATTAHHYPAMIDSPGWGENTSH